MTIPTLNGGGEPVEEEEFATTAFAWGGSGERGGVARASPVEVEGGGTDI